MRENCKIQILLQSSFFLFFFYYFCLIQKSNHPYLCRIIETIIVINYFDLVNCSNHDLFHLILIAMSIFVKWYYFLFGENLFMAPSYYFEILWFSSFRIIVTTFASLYQAETEAKLKYLHFCSGKIKSVSWIFLIGYWDNFYHLFFIYRSLFGSSFAVYSFIYFFIGFKVIWFHFARIYHFTCYIFNGCHLILF